MIDYIQKGGLLMWPILACSIISIAVFAERRAPRLYTLSEIEQATGASVLATIPPAYVEASCCRAPLLPLFTRDVIESGLICQHCGQCCVTFEESPSELQKDLRAWAEKYNRR